MRLTISILVFLIPLVTYAQIRESDPYSTDPPPPTRTLEDIRLPPPPPAPPSEEEPIEIFAVVEKQPLFPGCTEEAYPARKDCSYALLHDYLYEQLEMPKEVQSNSNAPRIFFRFIVETDGSISNPEIIRFTEHSEIELKILEILLHMPNWEPAMRHGRPVRFRFTMALRINPD